MKDFLNQEFAAGHVWRLRAPANTRFDAAPGGTPTSADPTAAADWAKMQQAFAGKTPMSAPLSFGQYQGPPSMMAAPGATSTNAEWNQLRQAIAGTTPISAPAALGGYQAPAPVRPPRQQFAGFGGFGPRQRSLRQQF